MTSGSNLSRNLAVLAIGLDLIGLYGLMSLAFLPAGEGPQWGLATLPGAILGIAAVVIARRDRKRGLLILGLAATVLGLIGLLVWVSIISILART